MTAITRRLGSCSPIVYGLPIFAALLAGLWPLIQSHAAGQEQPSLHILATAAELENVHLLQQTADEAAAKGTGCVKCHENVGDPHFKDTLHLGCVDCHAICSASATVNAANTTRGTAASGRSSRAITGCGGKNRTSRQRRAMPYRVQPAERNCPPPPTLALRPPATRFA